MPTIRRTHAGTHDPRQRRRVRLMTIRYAPGEVAPQQLEALRQQAEAARQLYDRANALYVPFCELYSDLFNKWHEAQLAYECAKQGVVMITEVDNGA